MWQSSPQRRKEGWKGVPRQRRGRTKVWEGQSVNGNGVSDKCNKRDGGNESIGGKDG